MAPAGCLAGRSRPSGAPRSRMNAAAALHTQLDEDWAYWMSQYPELATSFGVPGHNARWTDYSPAAIDARATYLKDSFARMAAISRAELGPDDQINYDLYREIVETAVK